MRTNVEKVLERDAKLSELDDRADALQQGASQFEQQAGKLKRKFWLQNLKVCIMSFFNYSLLKLTLFISLKMMIIMGVIGLVIVGIIASKCFVPKSLKHTLQLLLAHDFTPQSLHKRHTHTYQHSILYPRYQSKLILLISYDFKIPKIPLFRSDLTLISEHTTKFVYFLIPQRFFL